MGGGRAAGFPVPSGQRGWGGAIVGKSLASYVAVAAVPLEQWVQCAVFCISSEEGGEDKEGGKGSARWAEPQSIWLVGCPPWSVAGSNVEYSRKGLPVGLKIRMDALLPLAQLAFVFMLSASRLRAGQ
jgi:hypothetical protein